jgi:hypothetical protein
LETSRTIEERKAKDDLEKNSGRGSQKKKAKHGRKLRALAQNRVRWQCFVEALCSREK